MPRKRANWMSAFPEQIRPVARARIETKPRKRLPKVSKRRVQVNRDYAKAKREWKRFLIGIGLWKCKKCGGVPSDSPHHHRGRSGVLMCYQGFFVPLCLPCHRWVDRNRSEAIDLGLLCQKGDWGRQPRIDIVTVTLTGKCKGCGFTISPESTFCGECLCEEDSL